MYSIAELRIDNFICIGTTSEDALLINVDILIIIVVQDDEVVYEGGEKEKDLLLAEVLFVLEALGVDFLKVGLEVFEIEYYLIILAANLITLLGLDIPYPNQILPQLRIAHHLPHPHFL